MPDLLVLIKGAGDLASGVAHRLYRCGFVPVMTELPGPLVVRRTVAFAEAVYSGRATVEGVPAALAGGVDDVQKLRRQAVIPLVVDPAGESVRCLKPAVLVDATMAKRNTGTGISDAPVVIALGPGFEAAKDAHAVIETKRGHYLGRVILAGAALPDTGEPEPVMGYTRQRLLRAPADGVFSSCRNIGDGVAAGDLAGLVGVHPVRTQISGILRGLLRDGCWVKQGLKIGDVDPRGIPDYCYTISDKARAVAGGVLEAMLQLIPGKYEVRNHGV